MLERFQEHLRTSGLIPEGSPVLVGYSGGADSTCLLHLLKHCRIEVAAAHLHHGQRDEADKELRLCEAFCQELDIPFVSGRADVPGMSKELKIGLEEAGRKARYAFLQNAAFRLQCDLIATAHTRSDLVETVLLNLARGCGLHGLTGIPERRDNIVRPLLAFDRSETRAYCDEHGFWYHDDPANSDPSFARARIRHRVLKELRTINPAFDTAIERMVDIVREEDRFLNAMAVSALERVERRLNGNLRFLTIDCEVAFERQKVLELPPVLAKRGLRLAVDALGGALDFRQTESILDGLRTEIRGSVTADEGKIAVEWNAVAILVRQLQDEAPARHPLPLPGEISNEALGWSIDATPAMDAEKAKRTDLTIYVCRSKLREPISLRPAQVGDEIQPLGFSGHRKVSALLSDAKLTKAARTRLPIICDMVGPIWIPGVCPSQRVAPSSESGNVVRLRFGPVRRTESC